MLVLSIGNIVVISSIFDICLPSWAEKNMYMKPCLGTQPIHYSWCVLGWTECVDLVETVLFSTVKYDSRY